MLLFLEKIRLFSCVACAVWIATTAMAFAATGLEGIDPEARPVKPLRGIAYTEADILAARREVAENNAHAAEMVKLLAIADEWLGRSEAEIVALIPPEGSIFAYGRSAGDPRVNKPWPDFGRSGDMCSLERPGTVRSPHTGDIYGNAQEGEEYYDSGSGWTRPSDGRVFYFKGIWNSWVVGQLHDAIDRLAIAYLLTGRSEYADRALLIFDRLATLRSQMPVGGYTTADWPHKIPEHIKKGFFHYIGNHANRRAATSAYAFDLVANAPLGNKPSAGDSSLSVRENIAKNYFDIYELNYLDSRQLTNHPAMVIGNMLTQAVLFGNEADMQRGLDALYAMLDNTINRDGEYVEVSGLYAHVGRDYAGRAIAALLNYDPANYDNGATMPQPQDYPFNLKFGDDPRWYSNAVQMLFKMPIMGRFPQYGDMSSDRAVLLDQDNRWLTYRRRQYIRMLYNQTTREDWKQEMAALYHKIDGREASPILVEDLLMYGLGQWQEPPAPAAGVSSALGDGSEMMGAKGIAILRSGKGKDARALFIRGGYNSYHGHDDQMVIVPYGHGMVLTGEYGYGWSGTPDHLGWGTRSIAHMTAVVDEDMPPQYLYKGYSFNDPAPAASLTGLLSGGDIPAQMVEMRNPRLFPRTDLDEYRRTAWLVDVDAENYYFVDMFRISGGKTHDYVWNSPYVATDDAEGFRIEGINPVSEQGVWTLAALNEDYRDADWNNPGKSWGERLNGMIGRVVALEGEPPLPTSNWNPEPGNGYGMIWDVKSEETENDWQARWRLPDNKHFTRTHHLNYDGVRAMTALAPSIAPDNPFNFVLARRSADKHAQAGQLQSRFVTVMEVGAEGSWPLVSTETLFAEGSASSQAIGVKVNLASGATDYILSTMDAAQTVAEGDISLTGRNGFVRIGQGGAVQSLGLQEGTRLQAGGLVVQTPQAAFSGEIVAVYPGGEKESRLEIRGLLPAGDLLAGAPAWIHSGENATVPYEHNDYYFVETVEQGSRADTTTLVFAEQSFVFTTFVVDKVNEQGARINLFWNNELAGRPGTRAYVGRAVINAGSSPVKPLTHVDWISNREVKLGSSRGLQEGQKLEVMVAQPGDVFTIPTTVTLERLGDGQSWLLRTHTALTLTVPADWGSQLVVTTPEGRETRVALQKKTDAARTVELMPSSLGASTLTLRFE